ncbi:MAG: carbohydrate kinase [Chitinophagaceae bacterium]
MMNPELKKNQTLVCFGEILWDLLPTGAVPGGAPMNVAYHLHTLGLHPRLITRLGKDQRGIDLQRILLDNHIDIGLVQVDPLVPTGIVKASPDENGDMTYDIVTPAAWDEITIDPSLLEVVGSADYFIFGSLVARSERSRLTLLELLDHANIKVLDINLRAPNYTQPLVEQLMQRADVVKMNIDELALINAWYGDITDTEGQMMFLKERFALKSILVTRGAEGAIVYYDGQWASHPGFRVKVADTVGSGDSFLAGFLYSVINGRPVSDALAFACALGSFVATKTGAWPVYKPEEILS